MDILEISTFVDEAELTLRIIRSSILVSRQEGRASGPEIATETAALRESATRLGLAALATLAATIERESARSFDPGRTLSDADTLIILDLVAQAEAEVLRLKYPPDDANVAEFVDASFNDLGILSEAPDDLPASETAPEDEFEPDAEMLEIFSIEADELLANIESNLERLTSTPGDRDALWEVRRHAHTFKGAAGIIGLKEPSRLAHRIEDLLDHLAQNEIVPDTNVLELITASTECLRGMTKGDGFVPSGQKVTEIYGLFDDVMQRVTAGDAPPIEPQPEAVVEQPLRSTPTEAEDPKPATDANQPRRPIVRVAIARLDDLVHIVRDLVVSRSAVEQRVAEFERQLEALAKATRRLQTANARIETDFEASMLDTPGPAAFLHHRPFRADAPPIDEDPDTATFDALEFDRYTDFHESARELSEAVQECFSIGTSLEALKEGLETVIQGQRRLIEETQERVMQIRLIKFESLVTRLQRAVRVTCEEENKMAEVVIENPNVEMDTDLLDSLVEPLMHLIRNAVVHGIEPPETRRLLGKPDSGRITIRAEKKESYVELRVSDDGRGISAASLRERAVASGMIRGTETGDDLISLLCLAGLTTAEKLTMSAGRGVGMGIVRESVLSRNGSLAVESTLQQGTTFTIKVPLAFGVSQVLVVRSGSALAALPFSSVKRILEFSPTEIGSDGMIELGTDRCPVQWLADHFASGPAALSASGTAIQVEAEGSSFALAVDEILQTEEIAIRPLARPLDRVPGVLGAAVLANGAAVPVIDASYFASCEPAGRTAGETEAPALEFVRPAVMIVDDSPSVRHITSKAVSAAGWRVLTAKDGAEALEMLAGPERPGVILTDVEMPRMDGYELASAVKAHDSLREIPLVFITSRAGDKHRERASELGVTEYLTKPFIESELLNTIERLAGVPAGSVT